MDLHDDALYAIKKRPSQLKGGGFSTFDVDLRGSELGQMMLLRKLVRRYAADELDITTWTAGRPDAVAGGWSNLEPDLPGPLGNRCPYPGDLGLQRVIEEKRVILRFGLDGNDSHIRCDHAQPGCGHADVGAEIENAGPIGWGRQLRYAWLTKTSKNVNASPPFERRYRTRRRRRSPMA